jgi:hypothetical protein
MAGALASTEARGPDVDAWAESDVIQGVTSQTGTYNGLANTLGFSGEQA